MFTFSAELDWALTMQPHAIAHTVWNILLNEFNTIFFYRNTNIQVMALWNANAIIVILFRILTWKRNLIKSWSCWFSRNRNTLHTFPFFLARTVAHICVTRSLRSFKCHSSVSVILMILIAMWTNRFRIRRPPPTIQMNSRPITLLSTTHQSTFIPINLYYQNDNKYPPLRNRLG